MCYLAPDGTVFKNPSLRLWRPQWTPTRLSPGTRRESSSPERLRRRKAAPLTRAPHLHRDSVSVTVRFSNATGIPNIPDRDPNAGPRGVAVRFHLAEHMHTDIIAHSVDGFPARTADEFLELLRAIHASGPNAGSPPPKQSSSWHLTKPRKRWAANS